MLTLRPQLAPSLEVPMPSLAGKMMHFATTGSTRQYSDYKSQPDTNIQTPLSHNHISKHNACPLCIVKSLLQVRHCQNILPCSGQPYILELHQLALSNRTQPTQPANTTITIVTTIQRSLINHTTVHTVTLSLQYAVQLSYYKINVEDLTSA